VTLATAPIEMAGAWGKMIPGSAQKVVELMRRSCLRDVRLVSDRQPARLRVDEHPSGSPAVWLHDDPAATAWVIVDIGQQAWCQLAYQFGHELGHVLANSWQRQAKAGGTCQWLEESLVEAFSLMGLAHLAQAWAQTPPFAGDNAYASAVLDYRRNVETDYRKLAAAQGMSDMKAWYARNRAGIEAGDGLNAFARAASLTWLAQYERTPGCVEALGALNRWPQRTRMMLTDYLGQWEASCRQLGASPILPRSIRTNLLHG
jgi:hypothetical protein